MPNIKFDYLYRDSANYKNFNGIVFLNPGNIAITELDMLIKSHLIDGVYFYAKKWGLPDLFNNDADFRNDPTWHEFERLAYSDISSNKFRVEDLILAITNSQLSTRQ